MNGTIINIQRYCVDDGPGIRTTIFLKGCPLHCEWCHNPESQLSKPELMYDAKKCILCGNCVNVCPNECHHIENKHSFNRNKCIGCGRCTQTCHTNALELYGKILSTQEVFEEVKRDKIFYDISGGGVTISGGEPLYQYKFTAEILKLCKENGIHTAIETSGFASSESLLEVVKYCDLILFDIKETDEEKHKTHTGASLSTILKNLKIINENKIPFIIRAPIIPTINDNEKHFLDLKNLSKSLEFCKGVEIMPYHKLGAYKYELLGRKYLCDTINEPNENTVRLWRKFFN